MNIEVSDFFNLDYVDQASYDNLRKIASCIDGLKNSSRKVVYTVLEKNIYDLVKVSQLSSKAGEFADYLHGSLDGVIVTLAQDFLGTNQVPLLKKKGNFGWRAIQEPSASRYIFACGSQALKQFFNEQDRTLLVQQEFEGEKIEPMFYTPEIPMLLVNGSRGVSSGFAQYILSRPLDKIVKILKEYFITQDQKTLQKINKIKPFLFDFNGTVEQDQDSDSYKWLFTVDFEVIKNKILVKDLPWGSDLRSYSLVLDKLEEQKKIKSYKDISNESFLFEITLQNASKLSNDQIIKLLKLQTSVTENFTCIDQNNKIQECKSPYEILKIYVDVKEQYLEKRKQFLINTLQRSLSMQQSVLFFIESVLDNKIDFKKTTTKDLDDYFKQNNCYQDQDNFGYLHRTPMGKISSNEVQKIKDKIKQTKYEITVTQKSTVYDLWATKL